MNSIRLSALIGLLFSQRPIICAKLASHPPIDIIRMPSNPALRKCLCKETGVYLYSSFGISCNGHKKGMVKNRLPPDFSTLLISFNTVSISGRCSNNSVAIAQSIELSSSGICFPSQKISGFIAFWYTGFSISIPI